MSDVSWGSVPNGIKDGVTIVASGEGVLNPVYVAARDSLSKVGGGSSVPFKNGKKSGGFELV